MDLETLFSVASALVLPGWLLLAVAPQWKPGTDVIAPVVIPGLLAVLYLVLAVHGLGGGDDGAGFGSLGQVRLLFGRDEALLAGWVHYLVFDLVVGSWEVRDARTRGVRHILVIPCLLFTFLLGPIGYLAYLLLREATGRGLSARGA